MVFNPQKMDYLVANMDFAGGKSIKVCRVATVELAIRFLLFNQIRYLQERGYDMSVVCSPGVWIQEIEQYGISYYPVFMTRRITPFQDFIALLRLIWYFRKEKFSIVHTHTPKAGFLGTIAARLVRVPIIIHTNHGFYFHEHSPWLKKQLFVWVERIIAWNAHLMFSLDKEDIVTAKQEHIADEKKMKYLGGGINLERFNPERFSKEFIAQKKQGLGIPEGVPVIGIVARLVREKGYFELFEAMKEVIARFPGVVLLSIGFVEPEKKDGFDQNIAKEYGIEKNVRFLGMRTDVDELYPLMDVFTLPSYREGIGSSVLEASAMMRPIVATNVRGCREAVDDRVTGILVPYQNSRKLAEALLWILEHPEEARRMGEGGRRKIEREFNQQLVFERLEREYQRLIKEKLVV